MAAACAWFEPWAQRPPALVDPPLLPLPLPQPPRPGGALRLLPTRTAAVRCWGCAGDMEEDMEALWAWEQETGLKAHLDGLTEEEGEAAARSRSCSPPPEAAPPCGHRPQPEPTGDLRQ
jgi:hypothetical protein